jgi:hypothetical protein
MKGCGVYVCDPQVVDGWINSAEDLPCKSVPRHTAPIYVSGATIVQEKRLTRSSTICSAVTGDVMCVSGPWPVRDGYAIGHNVHEVYLISVINTHTAPVQVGQGWIEYVSVVVHVIATV